MNKSWLSLEGWDGWIDTDGGPVMGVVSAGQDGWADADGGPVMWAVSAGAGLMQMEGLLLD